MESFDILHSSLTGTYLIEASAGTGKTYTLEGVVVRLILNHQIPIERILAVTFTNNAVEELKNRIRKKLVLVKEQLKGNPVDDDFVQNMAREIADPEQALEIINNALVDFDQAAIYTIHGFCQRVLREQAFETNTVFETELVPDPSQYAKEAANDFWRSHFYSAPREMVSFAFQKLSGPDYFANLYARFFHPDALIIPRSNGRQMPDPGHFRACFQKAKSAWAGDKQQVLQILSDPVLDGRKYGSIKSLDQQSGLSKREIKVQTLAKSMDTLFDNEPPLFPLSSNFKLFTQTLIKASTAKNKTAPDHPFLILCDEMENAANALSHEIEAYLRALEYEFLAHADKMIAAKKVQHHFMDFDDLLIMVRDAINSAGGEKLAKTLREKYHAVLVDEFQDTDAIQYDIFSTVFGKKDNMLCMIGDPKQAIYGFRGADIFSYMKAVDHAGASYTLKNNWRSTPGLITAVNTIFTNQPSAFVFEKIPFEPVTPGKRIQTETIEFETALTLWHLFSEDNPENRKPWSAEQATHMISKAVANEIANLSQNDPVVSLKDIAVLVRTNRQASLIMQQLALKQIPSVVYYSGNIFETAEAEELQRILYGLAEPSNDRKIKAALATRLLGAKGSAFDVPEVNDFWENQAARLQQYAHIWKKQGFMRMFRFMLTEEKIKQRLIVCPDGERSVTNLLHLGELLHQADMEKRPGIQGLVKWLGEQREKQAIESDDHLLRLEKEAHAVKIVTIHKSKGLEYPVVFCPFGWENSLVPEKPAIQYHDPESDNELVVDLGSELFDKNKNLAQQEKLAENLRLYYVALTRAKQKCYLAWGRIKNADTSAPAYLFHYPKEDHGKDIVSGLKTAMSEKEDRALLADLQDLAAQSAGTIELVDLNRPRKDLTFENAITLHQYQHRSFSGRIDNSWKITSYSHLTANHNGKPENADRDSLAGFSFPDLDINANKDIPADFSDIVQFPKGTQAGLFFHDLFEHLDFANADRDHREQVTRLKMKEYGISDSWKPAIIRMIGDIATTPLYRDVPGLTLSEISLENRINEMEFYYPINDITSNEFHTMVLQNTPVDMTESFSSEKLSFSPVKGFMRGFIDMIFCYEDRFYILDWKSNYLGPHSTDYLKQNINNAMIDHRYHVQYLIYTLALDQYLSSRMTGYDFEKHFGGVFYLFIRGMRPENGMDTGIFFDRPALDNIRKLASQLIR